MDPSGWTILALYGFGFLAIIFELFIPSHGMLTLAAMGCFIAAVVLCFFVSQSLGIAALVLTGVIVPAFIIYLVKKWPNTSLGRKISLRGPRGASVLGQALPSRRELSSLVGREGISQGPLRPVGICMIDDRRIDCHAETGLIGPDTPVVVTKVEGNVVTVREHLVGEE